LTSSATAYVPQHRLTDGERSFMPAKSKKQQMAAGAALSAKRGERSRSSLRGASKQMAASMSEDELEKMASAKRKKLPRRAAKKTAGRKSTARKSASGKTARKSTAKKSAGRRKAAKRSSARKKT
jgi:hypothetical protein